MQKKEEPRRIPMNRPDVMTGTAYGPRGRQRFRTRAGELERKELERRTRENNKKYGRAQDEYPDNGERDFEDADMRMHPDEESPAKKRLRYWLDKYFGQD